jgi:hypothetical protein
MLNRQIVYFISKYGGLAKFTAAKFFALQHGERPDWACRPALFDAIRNRTKASFHDSP